MPSDGDCDVKISGGEEHLVNAAAAHMVAHHGRADAPELRDEVCKPMKSEASD